MYGYTDIFTVQRLCKIVTRRTYNDIQITHVQTDHMFSNYTYNYSKMLLHHISLVTFIINTINSHLNVADTTVCITYMKCTKSDNNA